MHFVHCGGKKKVKVRENGGNWDFNQKGYFGDLKKLKVSVCVNGN